MGSSDFKLPDDFPDLSIPDSTDKVSEPLRPLVRSAPGPWREGDRVLAPWEPQFLYVGRITQLTDSQALIAFDDGDAGWVLLDQLRPLAVQRGQQVLSRRHMGPYYYPAEILEVRGDEVRVGFSDGTADEWTRIAALRIPCQARGPAADPIRVASHQAFLENLQPGARVWAPWHSASLFAGTVAEIREREAHIHFDDGDRGWVLLEQVVPLEIPVGLHVHGRWKMGVHYYPATVTAVEGERIHLQYDDGDQEWTRAAALALQCEPFGPDARPTRTAVAAGSALGWVVPVILGLSMAFLRINCR